MDPGQLKLWEPVLQSPVAVSLLLLAALIASWGVLLVWIHRLYRDREALHREFRTHLESDLQLRTAVDEWAIQELVRSHRGGEDAQAT